MSDTKNATTEVRRRGRDRANENMILVSCPRVVDERAALYNAECAPHLSQNAFWVEAMIFYLDSKNARFPEPKS